MSRPILAHDPEFTVCPWYIKLERENGRVDMVDLRGAKTMTTAIRMAIKMGYTRLDYQKVIQGGR